MTNRSIRKSLPLIDSSSGSMFFSYSPVNLSMQKLHKPLIRSPLVDEPEVRTPEFVWEAEYQDKMPVLENSISQVRSSERRQMNFQFIDDMKADFDLKSLQSKRKRPTIKQISADNKNAARKGGKGPTKVAPAENQKKRRPRNAFILYRTVLQAKAEFKGKTQTELSRLIAVCWQREPPETRAHFERAAELEKAFGYGATDVFNIKVGPASKDWDVEDSPDGTPRLSEVDDSINSPFIPEQQDYPQPMTFSVPMYVPYSPPFEQPHDPYEIQATSLQMMGPQYTDSPVYAGTPCHQINLSPQQSVFPFSYHMDSTPGPSAPMSPQTDYGRESSTFYAGSMEHPTPTPNESFTLTTSAPDVSEIPANYSFDMYAYNSTEPHSVNPTYTTPIQNPNPYQYNSGNEMYPQSYQAPSDGGIYMQSQYQSNIEGYHDMNGQMFDSDPFPQNIHYQ